MLAAHKSTAEVFFFQAEDGIRDVCLSRGLGDVYKRQPPECGLKEGHDWDLQVIRWLDELGYQEVWIGEHHTAPWEPHPAPDLLLAQAFLQTKNIRLGPGGFLLPYHHPAELANRVAMLDHLS